MSHIISFIIALFYSLVLTVVMFILLKAIEFDTTFKSFVCIWLAQTFVNFGFLTMLIKIGRKRKNQRH